jgi:hypothetical protein
MGPRNGYPAGRRVPDPQGWVWSGALERAGNSVYAGGFRTHMISVARYVFEHMT